MVVLGGGELAAGGKGRSQSCPGGLYSGPGELPEDERRQNSSRKHRGREETRDWLKGCRLGREIACLIL